VFDVNSTNQINFRDFVRTLWIFSENAPKELKLKFAFEVFDVDNDGKISEKDLYHVMSIMVGKQFSAQKLSQIVSKLIQNGQSDRENAKDYLTFDELVKTIGEDDIVQKMTIEFKFS